MSGYTFMENMNKPAPCKSVTQKLNLLCLIHYMSREIRFNKRPKFSKEFEYFLRYIKIEPTPSSVGNALSNRLVKAAVKSAKILLWKSIEEKTNYAETHCHFNQAPRKDGYTSSELFHGRMVRSKVLAVEDSVNMEEGNAAREKKDLHIVPIHN